MILKIFSRRKNYFSSKILGDRLQSFATPPPPKKKKKVQQKAENFLLNVRKLEKKIIIFLRKKLSIKMFFWTRKRLFWQPRLKFFGKRSKIVTPKIQNWSKKDSFCEKYFSSKRSYGHLKGRFYFPGRKISLETENFFLQCRKGMEKRTFLFHKMSFSSEGSTGHVECIFAQRLEFMRRKFLKKFAQFPIFFFEKTQIPRENEKLLKSVCNYYLVFLGEKFWWRICCKIFFKSLFPNYFEIQGNYGFILIFGELKSWWKFSVWNVRSQFSKRHIEQRWRAHKFWWWPGVLFDNVSFYGNSWTFMRSDLLLISFDTKPKSKFKYKSQQRVCSCDTIHVFSRTLVSLFYTLSMTKKTRLIYTPCPEKKYAELIKQENIQRTGRFKTK